MVTQSPVRAPRICTVCLAALFSLLAIPSPGRTESSKSPGSASAQAGTASGAGAQDAGAYAGRERLSFDADWKFTKGDPEGTPAGALSYTALKPWLMASGAEFARADAPSAVRPPGEPYSASCAQPGFDDGAWRALDLPHDWGIEGPFEQSYSGDTGKLPWWGVGWYRKHFQISAADRGRRISLEVDGAMAYAAIWVNGRFAGGWPYGYASFQIDLTPYLVFDGDNVVAIRLDNPPDSSRWYPGGGIYRNVWLAKTSPVHIAHWGETLDTPRIDKASATVAVTTVLQNETGAAAEVSVATTLYALNARGERLSDPIARIDPARVRLPAGRSALSARSARVPNPRLWSPSSPALYLAVTTVSGGGRAWDQIETRFGIRTIAFDPDRGFLLNGERIRIQGVCDHHDLGALGAAINVRALERQIDLLQEMGCNAIRTSHNPPAPELLDLCDRKGMLVMDESFDCWIRGKRPNDYHLLFQDWHERDLRALVRRDRNHPSIILWSIGNEVPDQSTPEGWRLAAHLTSIVSEEDRTRPTTSACNSAESGYNGFQVALGVMGYNYHSAQYVPFHSANPDIALIGSETASAVSTRGAYYFPVSDDKALGRADFQVSSYDLYAPPWAWPPDVEFEAEDRNAFVGGEFVWTGFDYLGEPTPYNSDSTNLLNFTDPADQAREAKELAALGRLHVPSRSSYFGIIDLAGFKKDRFFLYQSHWRPELPMAHLLPHWTWPERVGQVTPVFVYTSGDEAELFLNGRSLGRKRMAPFTYRLRWDDVRYQPGELKVVAYKAGRRWASDSVRTAGPAAKLTAIPDRSDLAADGADLSFVTLSVRDRTGSLVPRASNVLRFSVTGPGEILAVDNGDPTSFEPFHSEQRKAFNGLCLAIIRTKPGQPGTVTLTAESEGLEAARINLKSH